MVLTVTENKVKLIDLICQQVQEKTTYIPTIEESFKYKLVISVSRHVPHNIHIGIVIARHDLTTHHIGADVNILQQIVIAAERTGNRTHYSNLIRY